MIRFIWRFLFLVIALSILGSIVQLISSSRLLSKTSGNYSGEYERTKVYWLTADQPLMFEIPSNTAKLRLAFNQIISDKAQSKPSTVQWRLGDRTGEWVMPASNAKDLEDPIDLRRFFGEVESLPATSTANFVIEPNLKFGNNLEISLRGDSNKLAIRLYMLEQRSAKDAQLEWIRMSKEQQQEVMEGHIYPPDLIPFDERIHRLSYGWKAIGPLGEEGKEFDSTWLFIRSQNTGFAEATNNAVDPRKLLSSNDAYTFFSSDEDAYHSFSCVPVDAAALSSQLAVRFKHSKALTTSDWKFNLERNEQWELPIKHGLYEITTSSTCELKFFNRNNQPLDNPINTRTAWGLSLFSPVIYNLEPVKSAFRVIRVDARKLISSKTGEFEKINWSARDENNNVLLNDAIFLRNDNNPYERLLFAADHLTITDVTRVYLILPAKTTKLVFTSNRAQALLNVYSRPFELAYRQNPSSQWWATNDPLALKWFSLKPFNDQNNKAKAFNIQWTRPFPEESEKRSSPLERFVALNTQKRLAKFELIEPVQVEEQTEASSLIYNAVPKNGHIIFADAKDRMIISPSMLFFRTAKEPVDVVILADNKPLLKKRIAGTSGKLLLPNMKVGNKQLTIKHTATESIEWFINFTQPTNSSLNLRTREAYSVEKEIVFSVAKSNQSEWLGILYNSLVTDRAMQPVSLTIELLAQHQLGQYDRHTIPIQKFDWNPLERNDRFRVLNRSRDQLSETIKFGFWLGDDIAPGNYLIRLSLNEQQSGYVSIGYLQEGLERKVSRYNEVLDDEN